jgi:hypothetical protein
MANGTMLLNLVKSVDTFIYLRILSPDRRDPMNEPSSSLDLLWPVALKQRKGRAVCAAIRN